MFLMLAIVLCLFNVAALVFTHFVEPSDTKVWVVLIPLGPSIILENNSLDDKEQRRV